MSWLVSGFVGDPPVHRLREPPMDSSVILDETGLRKLSWQFSTYAVGLARREEERSASRQCCSSSLLV